MPWERLMLVSGKSRDLGCGDLHTSEWGMHLAIQEVVRRTPIDSVNSSDKRIQ